MNEIRLGSGYVQAVPNGIILAAECARPVSGLTHSFYRYPARFSPVFVRAAIEAFSEPGDWVVDPFVGGGTTLVEALALGRNALGIDISSLATFVCKAKTLILTDQDISTFQQWMALLPSTVNMHAPSFRFESYADAGYYRNLEGRSLWRFRKAIEQCLASVQQLRCQGARTLARCVVLRTTQWALDTRKTRPSIPRFRMELGRFARTMLEAALAFRERVKSLACLAGRQPQVICINRNTAGADAEDLVKKVCPPKLIVTSPPYPGIHVLYHRWQVDGGREAPAPFWITGTLDGAGSSYYTMGDRNNPKLRSYFESLEASFQSVARMAGPQTTIVQMVAFADVEWQLPRYLEVMKRCGLREELPWNIDTGDGRIWRDVPNRKWHAQQRSHSPGAREVVLVHRIQ